jgi:hypothetical protein
MVTVPPKPAGLPDAAMGRAVGVDCSFSSNSRTSAAATKHLLGAG